MAMVAWCPALYLLMLFIAKNRIGAMMDSAADWGEEIAMLFVGLILYGIGGHIAYGIVVAKLIPPPRRRARLVLLPIGAFVSFVTGLATAQPVLVALTTVAVPGALGYWAAAPRPTAPVITAPDDQPAPADAR